MQAIIITAYRNLNQVAELSKLLSDKFEVYIHIDKNVSYEEIEKSNLKESEHIKIYSLYKTNWGGCNHLKAILYLMNEVIKNGNISFIHTISGEDWPVRSVEEIYNFFEGKKEVYICSEKLDKRNEKIYKFRSNFQKYYYFLDIFNYKKVWQKILVKAFVILQRILGVNRLNSLEIDLANGLIWGDFPIEAVIYCLNYIYENPEFLNFLSYGSVSEEFFFQSILSNSEYWNKKIVNKNFRYMIWKEKNGSCPGILDIEDFNNIISGDYMFARKIRFPISKDLISKINYRNVTIEDR